jgi:hypothetical protein
MAAVQEEKAITETPLLLSLQITPLCNTHPLSV